MFGVTNPRLVGPKRTFKFSLYKLMAMRAASYVCELRPALNVPNGQSLGRATVGAALIVQLNSAVILAAALGLTSS